MVFLSSFIILNESIPRTKNVHSLWSDRQVGRSYGGAFIVIKESSRALEISHFQPLLRGTNLKSKLILEIFLKFKTLAREKKLAAVTAEDSGEIATSCRGKATGPVGASLTV